MLSNLRWEQIIACHCFFTTIGDFWPISISHLSSLGQINRPWAHCHSWELDVAKLAVMFPVLHQWIHFRSTLLVVKCFMTLWKGQEMHVFNADNYLFVMLLTGLTPSNYSPPIPWFSISTSSFCNFRKMGSYHFCSRGFEPDCLITVHGLLVVAHPSMPVVSDR